MPEDAELDLTDDEFLKLMQKRREVTTLAAAATTTTTKMMDSWKDMIKKEKIENDKTREEKRKNKDEGNNEWNEESPKNGYRNITNNATKTTPSRNNQNHSYQKEARKDVEESPGNSTVATTTTIDLTSARKKPPPPQINDVQQRTATTMAATTPSRDNVLNTQHEVEESPGNTTVVTTSTIDLTSAKKISISQINDIHQTTTTNKNNDNKPVASPYANTTPLATHASAAATTITTATERKKLFVTPTPKNKISPKQQKETRYNPYLISKQKTTQSQNSTETSSLLSSFSALNGDDDTNENEITSSSSAIVVRNNQQKGVPLNHGDKGSQQSNKQIPKQLNPYIQSPTKSTPTQDKNINTMKTVTTTVNGKDNGDNTIATPNRNKNKNNLYPNQQRLSFSASGSVRNPYVQQRPPSSSSRQSLPSHPPTISKNDNWQTFTPERESTNFRKFG
eukprot:13298798-Ditylum_brightwellii.AAC.1